MRRKGLILAGGTATAVVVVAAVVASFLATVSVEYDPQAPARPVHIASIYGAPPEEVVKDLLLRSGRLPPPGAQLVSLPYGDFAWKPPPLPSAPLIAGIVVQRVKLTTNEPLLIRLLDDDPTYGAEIDVVVTSSDGQVTTLHMTLWDYGFLTPWGLLSGGDGLKPGRVHWTGSSA